nr:hypothetical protein Iba_scaffold1717CG0260 [Ipomoea batatas]GME19606.1 hypothetical protein Iba_scaffold23332CG0030 [Ipomoea batatas]
MCFRSNLLPSHSDETRALLSELDVEAISGDEDADEHSQAKSIHSVVVRHHHRRPVAGVHADVLHRQGNGRFSGLWKSESCCSSSREQMKSANPIVQLEALPALVFEAIAHITAAPP